MRKSRDRIGILVLLVLIGGLLLSVLLTRAASDAVDHLNEPCRSVPIDGGTDAQASSTDGLCDDDPGEPPTPIPTRTPSPTPTPTPLSIKWPPSIWPTMTFPLTIYPTLDYQPKTPIP